MDLATIIGLIGGAGMIVMSVITSGGSMGEIIDIPSVFMTIGGSFMALFICGPLKKTLGVFGVMGKAFKVRDFGEKTLVQNMVALSEKARREGILALESRVEEIQDPFFRNGLSMVIDGMDPEFVGDVLDAELTIMEQRHAEMRSIFSQAGTYAPTLGVLGAVVGLIAALGNLNDIDKLGHSIAAAFVATILGIFTGYVLWLPFANKLKIKSENEVSHKRTIMEGILSLQAGDSPTQIESKLMIYIPQGEREAAKE